LATHCFQPTRYHNSLGSHEPVLHIDTGDTVVTSTVDANGRDAHGEQVATGTNPQTGPFYIRGAEPGDTLVVHFDSLRPNRDTGNCGIAVSPNIVEPQFVLELPHDADMEWRIDLEQWLAVPVMPPERLRGLTLPLKPMLGCFGVAPVDGQAISSATSGPHGGNMDYSGFGEGVDAYLPVFVPGALFHLGDGHALQGDGEIVGNGIEVSFDVKFTAKVIKGKRIHWPRGENGEHIFTVGNARPLDQAAQHATTEMLRWLQEDYGLEAIPANILLGLSAEYELGNMYNPAYTMACKLLKRLLKSSI